MSWSLYRPDHVAALVRGVSQRYHESILETIERVLANPFRPAGCVVDRIPGQRDYDRDRLVVDAGFGIFITYEVCEGIAPLMGQRFVRIIHITALGEYQRPI